MLTRALILWVLSEGPRHGYLIRRSLGDEGMRLWFPLEPASIYSALRTLVKLGFARAAAVEQEGRRPERTVYAITRNGRTHLRELLRAGWVELPAAGDFVSLALAARPELDEGEPLVLLRARLEALRARLAELERLRRAAPAAEMVERSMVLARAELRWVQRQIRRERQGTCP